jgi:hypothetical protein
MTAVIEICAHFGTCISVGGLLIFQFVIAKDFDFYSKGFKNEIYKTRNVRKT